MSSGRWQGDSSRARKRARTNEEPIEAHEVRFFHTGIHQNWFARDFKHRKVIFGHWVLFSWFIRNGFDFKEMFDYQEGSNFVGLRLDTFPFLVKQAFINFTFNVFEDASSLVKGKDLDLSVTSLNTMASSPNFDLKFFDSYSWTEMSDVEPLAILRVVLDDPSLDEVVKLVVSDLNIDRRLLHHMVSNIILLRTGKFEYVMFLDLFVMYYLLSRLQINLGHLLLNHLKNACEKKRHGLPYGMLFTQIF